MTLRIVGRSSSHFTRIVRVFAHELEIAHEFRALGDLFSQDGADYGENPALKLPVLVSEDGPWFGALSICQELSRRSARPRRVVWPAQLTERRAANAQELVLQGMTTEVGLIMRSVGSREPLPYDVKARESLSRSLEWLDRELPAALGQLDPARDLSFLEVSAYCFVTHLDFRQVVDTRGFANLRAFCADYGTRPSLRDTEFRFDA